MLRMYRAAQWTAFAFGIIATTLGIIFFRGVGAVGHRAAPKLASPSDNEKGKPLDDQTLSPENVEDIEMTLHRRDPYRTKDSRSHLDLNVFFDNRTPSTTTLF